MLRHGRSSFDERGATIVLVSVTMVVLLGFVAFVVDLGPVYNERRQDQTAADAAALAGAQHLAVSSADAASTALAIARQNLPTTYTDSDWTSQWASCTDPGRDPALYPILSLTTPCISFNRGFTRIRVHLPNQVVPTRFARVLGVSTLGTRATAEAQVQPPAGGGVLPFGVIGFSADIQNQICLTVAGGCGGNNSDTLRALDSPLVGNPQFGATRICRPAGFGTRIEFNAAMGVDHLLVVKTRAEVRRSDDCDIERPNTVYAQGLQGQAALQSFIDGLGLGLITGPSTGGTYPDTKPARLRRIPSSFSGWKTRQVAGVALDNRPLWEFIATSAAFPDIPRTCERRPGADNFDPSRFDPNPDSATSGKGRMQTCLRDYITGGYTKPLFGAQSPDTPPGLYDIQLSSRLAFTPSLPGGCCPDSGIGQGDIESFNLVFLQTVYLDSADRTQFNPGEGGTNPLAMPKFDGLSAFRITNTMVPATVLQTGPNGTLRGSTISLIR